MKNITIKVGVEVAQNESWSATRIIAKLSAEYGGALSHEVIASHVQSMTDALQAACLERLQEDERLQEAALPRTDTPEPEPAAP